MRLESPTGVAERDLFFRVDSEEDMKQIVKEGFKCVETEEQEKNILGTSEMGIHFSKNLDILIRNQYKNRKKSFYCVVTKALLNVNGKLVVPDPKNRNRDPDLNGGKSFGEATESAAICRALLRTRKARTVLRQKYPQETIVFI